MIKNIKIDFQRIARAELAVKAAVLETRAPIAFYSLPLKSQERIVSGAISIYVYEYENGPAIEEKNYRDFILNGYFNVIGKASSDGLSLWYENKSREMQAAIADVERELAQDALATACIHFGCR